MRVDPGDSVAFGKLRSDVLNQLVEKEVLLAEATRQAVTVTNADSGPSGGPGDPELEAAARLRSRSIRRPWRTRETTKADLRKRYEPDVRDQLIISRLVSKEVQSKVDASPMSRSAPITPRTAIRSGRSPRR